MGAPHFHNEQVLLQGSSKADSLPNLNLGDAQKWTSLPCPSLASSILSYLTPPLILWLQLPQPLF